MTTCTPAAFAFLSSQEATCPTEVSNLAAVNCIDYINEKMAPNNSLPVYGNDKTMNLNSLILTNIQSSPYFKVNLYELKTYHEVIDEIYYKVNHMEPWEKGSRKTAGQTGMCGGVRGVGAGGIVSSAFCLLYKLFTLKLTRKQVTGLITHQDSPYIRSLGFMYIRYTQPPPDLWDWYEDYLDDDEEIDVKAGGGHNMAIGEMLRQWLTKIEWYSTLFPRIPVPVQKDIAAKLKAKDGDCRLGPRPARIQPEEVEPRPVPLEVQQDHIPDSELCFGEAERIARLRKGSRTPPHSSAEPGRATPPFDIAKEIEKEKERQEPSRVRDREHDRDKERDRNRHRRSRSREKHGPRDVEARSRDRPNKSHDHRRRSRSRDRLRKERRRSRSHERKRSPTKRRSRSRSREKRHRIKHRSRSRERAQEKRRDRETSFERDLKREQKRHKTRDVERNGD